MLRTACRHRDSQESSGDDKMGSDDSHLAHVCADVKTGEGGYELAIIMSMIAHQRLRGGRVLGEGAGGGVDQDHRAEDDVPAHRRRSEDYEGRAETRR